MSALRIGLERSGVAIAKAELAAGRWLRDGYRRVRTVARPIEPARLEAAIQSRRAYVLSGALMAFLVGFTLDDLRVLRWPAYLVGGALALALFIVGPMVAGRRLANRHLDEPLPDFQARAARSRRIGRFVLLATALAFVSWLVVFSEGVPPWAR